jgi:hypothetical protein
VNYHGDIRLGDTIDVKFTTVNASGVPTTLAGTPVISAYVGNGTTEITAGVTLTVDFDARTGMHNVRVVATGANGFATATNVELVITTGTVGGVSVVGYCVGSFSIENRSAVMPVTPGRTLVVDAAGLADASVVKAGPTGAGVAVSAWSATRGLAGTALPAAAADAAGGLPTGPAAGLFAGISVLAQWLGLIAGKQTANATARTEVRATGAGGGTFDETSDSAEAIRDRGDAAWTTATGFSTHSAADVWAAGTRTLTSFGTLVADVAAAVWDKATSALTTAGSIGKKLADWAIHSAADVWAVATRRVSDATNITSTGGTTVPQTGDSFARIGAAGVSLSAIPDLAGVTTLLSRLTALRAAALDEVTAARMGALTDWIDGGRLDLIIDAVLAAAKNRVQKNTALAGFIFFMRDSTNHLAATGLTITAQRSLDGAALGACANAASEIGNGFYKIDLAAADLNANVVGLRLTAPGADDLAITLATQPT